MLLIGTTWKTWTMRFWRGRHVAWLAWAFWRTKKGRLMWRRGRWRRVNAASLNARASGNRPMSLYLRASRQTSPRTRNRSGMVKPQGPRVAEWSCPKWTSWGGGNTTKENVDEVLYLL
ncbi:hypothetical protein B0T21DRAFT_378882 [Apiosordaria backusii]|uniref:Uncharacterized protein n=1 Tax=Apiosordaria backusii TaxID=314023 RepID=A0AA39ZQ36_9PEZI|nr:hypothetical protein B0T21DRAFT_378882 [Apiosordaria backusii]